MTLLVPVRRAHLRLNGAGFDVRSFSPISRTIARLCTHSMSMRLRITRALRFVKNDATGRSASLPRSAAGDLNEPETAAFGYLRERLGRWQRTFGYPRHAPWKYRRATVSCLKPGRGFRSFDL